MPPPAGRQELVAANVFVVRIPARPRLLHRVPRPSVEVEVREYAEGGNDEFVHQLPGRLIYPKLELSRGLTTEDNLLKSFMQTRVKAERKEVIIDIFDTYGEVHRSFTFDAAYPVQWSGRRSPSAVAAPPPPRPSRSPTPGSRWPSRCRSPRASRRPSSRSTGRTQSVRVQPAGVHDRQDERVDVKPRTGVDLPDGEFGGGNPRMIRLALLLDVVAAGREREHPRGHRPPLQDDETGGGGGGGGGSAPPFVTFTWGRINTFNAVATSLSVQFKLFHPNSKPIHADVGLELGQAEKASTASPRAPAPAEPDHRPMRRIKVDIIADGDRWPRSPTRPTATRRAGGHRGANDIDNPPHLTRGRSLTIPRIDS